MFSSNTYWGKMTNNENSSEENGNGNNANGNDKQYIDSNPFVKALLVCFFAFLGLVGAMRGCDVELGRREVFRDRGYIVESETIPIEGRISTSIKDFQYDNLIARAATRYNVSPHDIRGIIRLESNFNPNATHRNHNGKTARGLMQVTDNTGRSHCGVWGQALYDPAKNIDCGTSYYSTQLKRFNSKEMALAAYFTGPNNVANGNWNNTSDGNLTTPNYIKKVMHNIEMYEHMFRERDYFANPLCDDTMLVITDDFNAKRGRRSRHGAVDIDMPDDETAYVCASIDGYVSIGYEGQFRYVQINNSNLGLAVRYVDSADNMVRNGEYVSRGERIMKQGTHGSGKHAHIEIYRQGKRVDPMFYLSKFPHKYSTEFDNIVTRGIGDSYSFLSN
ncbi:hypothetical protein DRJ17_01050 [Candidatus Woesearchaeota archaeon]|nr:MAG: hypothetical protein DRJ17_01050 [Candidatus Woesearchaeota archaeon]